MLTALVGILLACTPIINCHTAKIPAESGPASPRDKRSSATPPSSSTVLIEADEDGIWYGNFTLGANHTQRLVPGTGGIFTVMYPDAYSPSSQSKTANQTETDPVGNPNGTIKPHESVTLQFYSDVLGIPGFTARVDIGLIVKTEPPGLDHFKYAALPLSPLGGSWFQRLCSTGLAQCQFGFLMGTGRVGKLVFGAMDKSEIDGEMITVPSPPAAPSTTGDIVVQNKTYQGKATLYLGSPAQNSIQGPLSLVRKIFKELGITELSSSTNETLQGSFPCDKPPSFGFRIPSAETGKKNNVVPGRIFNVSPSAMTSRRMGGNKCVAALEGRSVLEQFGDVWEIGAPFFEGHYVNYNYDEKTIGIADLKDPTGLGTKSGVSRTVPAMLSSAIGILFWTLLYNFWM